MPGLAVPLRPQGMQSKARAGHCTTMLTTLWKWRAATQVLLQAVGSFDLAEPFENLRRLDLSLGQA